MSHNEFEPTKTLKKFLQDCDLVILQVAAWGGGGGGWGHKPPKYCFCPTFFFFLSTQISDVKTFCYLLITNLPPRITEVLPLACLPIPINSKSWHCHCILLSLLCHTNEVQVIQSFLKWWFYTPLMAHSTAICERISKIFSNSLFIYNNNILAKVTCKNIITWWHLQRHCNIKKKAGKKNITFNPTLKTNDTNLSVFISCTLNPFHTRFWNLHRLCTGPTWFP